ncbi:hypothetical protein AOLI_G00205740 [Acnodon oligacanthus]
MNQKQSYWELTRGGATARRSLLLLHLHLRSIYSNEFTPLSRLRCQWTCNRRFRISDSYFPLNGSRRLALIRRSPWHDAGAVEGPCACVFFRF